MKPPSAVSGTDVSSRVGLDLLKDPYIFLADSGATCDSVGDAFGMYNIKAASEEDGIMMLGNATAEKTAKFGTISGAVCDKYGKQQFAANIAHVAHIPGGQFNLFSIGRRLMQGWDIGQRLDASGTVDAF